MQTLRYGTNVTNVPNIYVSIFASQAIVYIYLYNIFIIYKIYSAYIKLYAYCIWITVAHILATTHTYYVSPV